MLYIQAKECYSPIRRNEAQIHAMDEPRKPFAKGEKPVRRDPLAYYSIHTKDPEKARDRWEGALRDNSQWVVFRVDENVLKLDNGNLLSSTITHTTS